MNLPKGHRRTGMKFGASDVPNEARAAQQTISHEALEPDAGEMHVTRERAQSVCEELAPDAAIRCYERAGRCFIQVDWNCLQGETFNGTTFWKALTGFFRAVQQRKQIREMKPLPWYRQRDPWHALCRRIRDFFKR